MEKIILKELERMLTENKKDKKNYSLSFLLAENIEDPTFRKKAEETKNMANQTGVKISVFDINSILTAMLGSAGAAANLSQVAKPAAWAIDAILVIKFLYDASQCFNAIMRLNREIKKIIGRDLFKGTVFREPPINYAELEMIESAPEHVKNIMRRYAISCLQYQKRALISLLGAIPDVTGTGAADSVLAGIAVVLSAAPIEEAIIAMAQALAFISDNFESLHEYAKKDTFWAKCTRVVINPGGVYNYGMILTSLNVLDPGTGDELEQYVDPSQGTRQQVQLDIQQANNAAAKKQEMLKTISPDNSTVPQSEEEPLLEFSIKRMQILAGI